MASAEVWTESIFQFYKSKIAEIIEPFPNDVVVFLAGLSGQSDQELVQLSRGVDQLGVEEGVGQWNHAGLLTLVVNLLYETEKQ